jgi:hypothetical protein
VGIEAQNGHLLVVTQAALDAYSDPGDLGRPGWMVPIRSGALDAARDLLVPDPEIGGSRDIPGASLGPVAFTGDFEMYARPRIMYPFIKSASMGWMQQGLDLGEIGSGDQSFGEGPISTPAAISVEQQIGAAGLFETTKYYNVVCNTWELKADAGGLAEFSVGLIGQYLQGVGSPTAPNDLFNDKSRVIPTSGIPDPAVGGYVLVSFAPSWGDYPTVLPAKSISISVNNNIEDDDFRLGSLYLAGITPKRREVTGSFGIRPEDASMWRQAVWGDSAASAPQGGRPQYGKLVTTVVGDPIPGTSFCQTFSIALQVALHPFSLDPSGDDVLEHSVDFTGMFPDGASTPAASISFIFSTVAVGPPEFR